MNQDRSARKAERPLCTRCEYYYVTWEQGVPHGCKAMGFKSREYPYSVAFHVSGVCCQMFKFKDNTDRYMEIR